MDFMGARYVGGDYYNLKSATPYVTFDSQVAYDFTAFEVVRARE